MNHPLEQQRLEPSLEPSLEHLEEHPFDQAVKRGESIERDRLAQVAPRTTYVVLCWATEGSGPFHTRPDAILGPFVQGEANRLASSLTCDCEVTAISTEPPHWATEGVSPGTGPAQRIR
jgi:hypothetical protein